MSEVSVHFNLDRSRSGSLHERSVANLLWSFAKLRWTGEVQLVSPEGTPLTLLVNNGETGVLADVEEARAQLMAAFGWTDGTYALSEAWPDESFLSLGNPYDLVFTGIHQHAKVSDLVRRTREKLVCYPATTQDTDWRMSALHSPEPLARLVACCDGRTRMATVMRHDYPDMSAKLKALFFAIETHVLFPSPVPIDPKVNVAYANLRSGKPGEAPETERRRARVDVGVTGESSNALDDQEEVAKTLALLAGLEDLAEEDHSAAPERAAIALPPPPQETDSDEPPEDKVAPESPESAPTEEPQDGTEAHDIAEPGDTVASDGPTPQEPEAPKEDELAQPEAAVEEQDGNEPPYDDNLDGAHSQESPAPDAGSSSGGIRRARRLKSQEELRSVRRRMSETAEHKAVTRPGTGTGVHKIRPRSEATISRSSQPARPARPAIRPASPGRTSSPSVPAKPSAQVDTVAAQRSHGRGVKFMQAEQWSQALGEFSRAASQAPDNVSYKAAVLWASYRNVPSKYEFILESLNALYENIVEDGYEQERWRAEIQLCMGRILAAENSPEDARQHLETALTHDPNNLAIQRAMEGLEEEEKPAEKSKGGLFARFRRKKGDDA